MKKLSVVVFASVAVLSSSLVWAEDSARAEQIAQIMQDRFTSADKNADAQLTPEEAKGKMPYVSRNFAQIDADKSGTVTQAEIRQHAVNVRSANASASGNVTQ